MFLITQITGRGLKAKTHAHMEIAHFPTSCVIMQDLERMRPQDECFPGPDDAPTSCSNALSEFLVFHKNTWNGGQLANRIWQAIHHCRQSEEASYK